MAWERTTETDAELVWKREDGAAEIVARNTAGGEWAVHYDRLIQAPEGETYRRETVPSRAAAVAVAETWREEE